MGFFQRIARIFSSPAQRREDAAYKFTVRCKRCGELVQGRVDIRNDLSINYGDSEADTTFFVRKVLIGENRCYQPIEVELTFNSAHQLIEKQVKGGEFVSED